MTSYVSQRLVESGFTDIPTPVEKREKKRTWRRRQRRQSARQELDQRLGETRVTELLQLYGFDFDYDQYRREILRS